MDNKDKKENEIIPTVMPDSFKDFVEKIERVYRYVKTIQIDVMDGKFVPSISWPYNSRSDKDWEAILKQKIGIPYWQECDFEIDLMVVDQLEEANNWIDAGVMRVIGHYEAFKSADEIEKFLNLKEERGVEVYLAMAPSTENAVLEPYFDRLDGVQFMGIEKVGFQGQPFDDRVLEKIAQLRAKMPDLPIAVDGGVNFETATKLISAGATKLSSGSLIFEANNVKEVIDKLNSY